MFIVVLSTIGKIWKQPKYSTVDEWIKKCGISISNGLLFSLKKEEILPHVTIWMNVEDIMLSKINQSVKWFLILDLARGLCWLL